MVKLFVLVRKDLEPRHQAVQAGHAVAQWVLDFGGKKWNNETLVYVNVDNETDLLNWMWKMDVTQRSFSAFREPNFNNQTTAAACLSNDSFFSKLKLMGEL
jgi:hypothetical protein